MMPAPAAASRRRRRRRGAPPPRRNYATPLTLLLLLLSLVAAATAAAAATSSPPSSFILRLLNRRGGSSISSTSNGNNGSGSEGAATPPQTTPGAGMTQFAASSSSSSSSASSSSSSEGGGATEDMRGYDAHPSMFAPSGRIPQVEYAREAVSHGRPLVGVKGRDGVVLVGRKALESSKLQDGRLRQKLFRVDRHVLVGVTGMTADALALVRAARHYAQDYQRLYGEPVPVRHLAEYICDVKHVCTMVPHRPFGVALLVAGHDAAGGYQLYKTDPSASYEAWKGVVVGENSPALLTKLSGLLLPPTANDGGKEGEGKGKGLPTLARACAVACAVAGEGAETGDRSGGGGGGGKAGGDEEAPLTVQERAALLEMGVVRDGEVFFLEQGDIEGALRAFEGKEAEEATEE